MSLASAVVDVGADITKFRNSVQKDIPRVLDGSDVSGAGQRLGTKFSGAFTGALKIAGGLAAAVGVTSLVGFGAQAVKTGIGTAAAMETADIAFTTMLGSAEKADTFIRKLADFAKKTPFDFPGLQTAASSLISIGIDTSKVIPIMTTLGDVTSGMGTGAEGIKRATVALQQMNAAGRIQAQDLNQLRDAGIPVYDLLSAAMGKTKEEVAALAQNGGLGKDALDAMMKALETGKGLEKFSGLMDKQSASLSGLWSTLKDTVAMGLSKAFTPLIPVLKKTIDSISAGLEPALKVMSTTFKIVLAVLKPIFKLIKFLSPLIMSLVAAWAAYRAIMIVTNAVSTIAYMWANREVIMKALQIAMTKKLAAAQLRLNAALIANPIGLIVGALVVLGGLFVLLYKRSDKFRSVVNKAWAGIKETALAVVNWFKTTAWPVLKAVWDKLKVAIEVVWGVVKTVFGKIWGYLKFVFAVWKQLFKAFGDIMNGDWQKAWFRLQRVFQVIWVKLQNAIRVGLDKAIAFFKELPAKLKAIMGPVGTFLKEKGIALLKGLWNGIKAGAEWLWTNRKMVSDRILGLFKLASPISIGFKLLKGLWDGIKAGLLWIWENRQMIKDKIVGLLQGASEWLGDAGRKLLTGVWNGIKAGLSWLWENRGTIKTKIKNMFSNAKDWLKNAGRDLLVGLWNGINDKWDWVKKKIGELGGKLKNKVKDVFGIKSPSLVMAKEVGAPLAEGIGFGVIKELPTLNRSLADSMGKVIDRVSALKVGSPVTGVGSVAPISANSVVGSGVARGAANSDRPIYTDTGLLLGWMREVASGEARIVFNTQNSQTIQGIRLG